MEIQPIPRTEPAETEREAGALTFLFTDVEGSTPLWERHEAAMRAVTVRHDALLEGIIARHGGRRVKERGEGDSLFAVFADPAAAVTAALAMAQAVLAEPWPAETPIRVRMGLHTGSAQFQEGDYYGPVVNRCARIRSLGHGGQILLSSATAALVSTTLPDGAALRALGAHSLKGLSAPEEVFQLCHPSLPAEFPPLLSPQAPRHNLPEALSSLIGREAEQGTVLALLAEARLVTLTGSGGVGKTRLALAVAAEVVDQYPAGVWLVELAALAEPSLVPDAVAQALGIREEPGRPLLATLIDHLREKRTLLVLDNCEHVIAACAEFAGALVRSCPLLHVLATSREGLGVAGERRYQVPSLPVPDLAHLPPPSQLGDSAAVALFVARARERRPDFTLTGHNARAVASICTRLDGIPLAIELAAARVGILAVEGIAARLDDRFRLLTGGARDALPRQRTLRAALDWSYDLLGEPEQRLLDRLSVFAGGCTLGAAEAVCAGVGVAAWEVLDLLGGLVNKSLVSALDAGDEVRYGLLETVRQYGVERLRAGGEAEGARDRHLGWYLALAEEAEPALSGPEQAAWLDRLEAEHDNLRAALAWARERGAEENGLRLAGAMARFWQIRGHLSEGRGWLEAALAVPAPASPAVRAKALRGAGVLASDQGDLTRAATLLEESLGLMRTLGNQQGIAKALNNLGIVALDRGDFERAATFFEESLALGRVLGDRRSSAMVLSNLGLLAQVQGDLDRAAACYEESLALDRALGNTQGIASTLDNLGNVALDRGDYDRARVFHEESLALSRTLGNTHGIAMALNNLGSGALDQGEYDRAVALHEESLALSRTLGNRHGIAIALGNLGNAACLQGDHERAWALHQESLALHRALGDNWGIAIALSNLGLVSYERGEYRRAAALLGESIGHSSGAGARKVLAEALEILAWATVAHREEARATRLAGAAEALREALGAHLPPSHLARHEQAMRAMRAALDEETFLAAWTAGQALPLDEVVAMVSAAGPAT